MITETNLNIMKKAKCKLAKDAETNDNGNTSASLAKNILFGIQLIAMWLFGSYVFAMVILLPASQNHAPDSESSQASFKFVVQNIGTSVRIKDINECVLYRYQISAEEASKLNINECVTKAKEFASKSEVIETESYFRNLDNCYNYLKTRPTINYRMVDMEECIKPENRNSYFTAQVEAFIKGQQSKP